MVSILKKQPIDLVKSKEFDNYSNELKSIWWEVVRLNSTIHILEQLKDFPFNMFYYSSDNNFFSLVWNNFIDYSILNMSRILTDTKSERKDIGVGPS